MGAATREDRPTALAAREGYVDFRGYRAWYRFVGDLNSRVTPLLTLHGGPGSTHNYFGPLEGLASEQAVVLYDQIDCGNQTAQLRSSGASRSFAMKSPSSVTSSGSSGSLLGTSWGGMLAQEHVLSGASGIVSLILSSTLANLALWNEEQLKLKAQLPPDVIEVLDRHEAAGPDDDPEYEEAIVVYFDRHFDRGPQPRPKLEAMAEGRAPDVYRAMQGPNEWTTTGALKGWDTRDQLHEIDIPTLVVRGRYDMCTEPIAAELVHGIKARAKSSSSTARTLRCWRRASATCRSSETSFAKPLRQLPNDEFCASAESL